MSVWLLREKSCLPNGFLYLLVDIWFGDTATGLPDLTNDFVMNINKTVDTVVKDGRGWWKLKTGEFVNPNQIGDMDGDLFEKITVSYDVRAHVVRKINDYVALAIANKWTGDHTGDATKPFFINGQRQSQGNQTFVRDSSYDSRQILADVGTVTPR